jgi:hypothetical protein
MKSVTEAVSITQAVLFRILQRDRTNMSREITWGLLKKLNHSIMEAEKSHDKVSQAGEPEKLIT